MALSFDPAGGGGGGGFPSDRQVSCRKAVLQSPPCVLSLREVQVRNNLPT